MIHIIKRRAFIGREECIILFIFWDAWLNLTWTTTGLWAWNALSNACDQTRAKLPWKSPDFVVYKNAHEKTFKSQLCEEEDHCRKDNIDAQSVECVTYDDDQLEVILGFKVIRGKLKSKDTGCSVVRISHVW